MTDSKDDPEDRRVESADVQELGARSPRVEEVLGPARARLGRHVAAGDELALLVRGARRDLTVRERIAVAEGWGLDVAPLDRLLAITASLSFKVALDLGLLEEGDPVPAADRDELALDVALIACVTSLVPAVLSLARNRADNDILRALAPVRARLEEFHRLLVDRAPEACQEAVGLRARSALRVEDFEPQPVLPKARSKPPPSSAKRKRVPGRSRARAAAARPAWRAPVLLALSIGLLIGAGLYVRRAVLDVGPRRQAEIFEAQELQAALPSATVLDLDEATRSARISVGTEWHRWAGAERQRRVLAAVAILADRGYSRIEFVEIGGGLVATWSEGIIHLL